MPKSPILGGFAIARTKGAADNQTVNLGVEVTESKDGKVPGFLFLMSGLDLVMTVGSGPIRGVLPLNDVLYVVSGMEVYSVTAANAQTLLGVIGDQKTPVSMFQNTKQLMIVDGVGAWLVPGGFPLTGGVIGAPSVGSLYKVNDTITLKAATGFQGAFPIVKVTGVSNNPVLTAQLENPGTTYATAMNVATTPIQPQAGAGTGLTINITGAASSITTATLGVGGAGYAVGDTGFVLTGGENAVYYVTGVAGGVVTTFLLVNRGTGYTTGTGVATKAAPAVPVNIGTGLTFDITAAGPITASTINHAGTNYVPNAVGFLSGGTGDATYQVLTVGGTGAVTSFSIVQGGAIDDEATSFTQLSTSGSGQGFTLTSPTYGAFVGLVPINLPWANPIKGGISDGFGVLVFQNQQVLAASAELDLSTWDALSFGVPDQSPDNTTGLQVIHDEVFVFKSDNTEVWTDEGLANFPFGPISSVHIEFGLAAPFSSAVVDQDLVWLSRNDQGSGLFVSAAAYQPKIISTQALTTQLDTYSNIGDCIAYSRQEGGHVYYVATFPEANVTWVYDKTTSDFVGYPMWTKLAAFDQGALNRHWGNAFTPWKGASGLSSSSTTFTAHSVTITDAILATSAGLNGLPLSFSTAVFSVWLELPEDTDTGIIFGNQGVGATPGLQITIQNDATGSPQMTIEAWDASSAPIVVATYDFTVWAAWVNVLMSIDTSTQRLQVFANTLVSDSLVESQLTAASITWSSTNPIAPSASQAWKLVAVGG